MLYEVITLVRHRLVTATALCIALGCTTARPILPGVDPGLRVLYKAHPEWEADLKHLFSGFDCEFIGGRFEA